MRVRRWTRKGCRSIQDYATGAWALSSNPMTELTLIQKKEQKRRALFEAQFSNAKAYRGVPYGKVTNGKAVHGRLTYRGVAYSK